MKRQEKVITREKIFEAKMFNIDRALIQLSNGSEAIFHIVDHPGAVVVLPVKSDGTIVMVRQWRRAVKQDLFEIVAGTLEKGEAPLECAKRELAEEANMAAESWQSLGELYPAPGFCNEIQYGYLARNLSPMGGVPDEDEIIEVVEMKYDEVQQKIASGKITDCKTLAFIMKAKVLGLL